MNGADPISYPLTIVATLLLAAVGTVAVAATCRKLRGTTLVGSQVWLGTCLVAVAAVEIWQTLAVERANASAAEPLQFFVATLTFCPLMALMGAKRPQDRAWHFIVLSLWIVLALPAMHVGLLRSGQTLSTPSPLAWFMLGLIVIGFFNRLLTPAWIGGLLFACGQTSLLAGHLPLVGNVPGIDRYPCELTGLGLIAASAVLSWWLSRRRRPSAEPLDRLWLEFRDLFGVLWALRLAERVNSAAALTNSDLVLRWSGFQTSAGGRITESLSPDAIRILRQGLENLLRRFVSRAWIAERLQESE
ncbi:MAG: hypothetical protein QGF59_05360 [Pirellulaceae bacterium]|jgi:hypothetical protein|nr:hypothetical protein [Pirellulaceae bacterium]